MPSVDLNQDFLQTYLASCGNWFLPDNLLFLHDKPVCLICGRYGTARHEVYFGRAYRAKSKRLGLWVTLCPWCHQNGPTAIHNNRDADLQLKCWAQKKAMEHYGWPEARFIQEFGRSYL